MKRSKILVHTLMAAALFTAATAQAQDVKGQNFLNAGIGLGTFGFAGTGGLPFTASFEHGVTDKISAGATFAYVKTKFLGNYKYTNYLFGARGSYHFNELLKVNEEKLDVYGGASLFYRGYKLKWKGVEGEGAYKSSDGGIDIALHAGARYQLTSKLSGYAELGYGISPLQLGLSVKF
jgi:hypothetical protein